MLVKFGFGAPGNYLIMAGYAGWELSTSIVSLVLTVGLSVWLIPLLEGIGGALAMLASAVFTMTCLALIVWRLDRFATVDVPVVGTIVISSGALVCASFGLVSPWMTTVSLLVVAAALGYLQNHIWYPSLLRFCNRRSEHEAS